MTKLSEFLVKKRCVILGCMIVLAAICVYLIGKVNIITDMTKYLPDDSAMKQGMDIMESEFPDTESEQTIRVMVNDITEEQKGEVLKELEAIPDISSVDYEADSEEYNKENHTMYILNTTYAYDSEEFDEIVDSVVSMESEWNLCYDTGDTSIGSVPFMILLLAFAILMIILFFMCRSWVEPFLFLATIGIAIMINMGTNAFLSGVSQTTYSIAAILQLVLSMDYSIILMNRYRQELEKTNDKELAMTAAIKNSFSSIASSSITTIVGLLALIFMKFKIGADMGIVLAKGVLISLVCILTVLPAFILSFDSLIQKTPKKVLPLPMNAVSKFSFRGKYVITGLFAVAFVVLCLVKGNTAITYSMTSQSEIDEVFPKTNTFVVLYDNKDEEKIQAIADALEDNENVKNVSAYATTIGKQYSADELKEMLTESEMTEGISLDDSMIQMIYYIHFNGTDNPKMTLAQFFEFMQNFMAQNKAYSSQIDEQSMEQIQAFGTMLQNPAYASQKLSASELYQLLGSQNTMLDENTIRVMYQLYFSENAYDNSWTMSVEELLEQMKQMEADEMYASLLPESLTDTIEEAESQLNEGKKQLIGKGHSRMIVTTSFPEESEITSNFLAELSEKLEENLTGESYVIGNSAMEYEMSQTFHSELNKISWITMIAIWIVLIITFHSVAVPLILVIVIQGAVYATMVVMSTFGGGIYYLALLIVQSILMGATIDYGILFSNYYRENRKKYAQSEALTAAYNGSIHTIMTSGLIMVLVTFILGFAFADPTIGEICHIISAGVLIAIVLILFVLPGILCTFDKFAIIKRK